MARRREDDKDNSYLGHKTLVFFSSTQSSNQRGREFHNDGERSGKEENLW